MSELKPHLLTTVGSRRRGRSRTRWSLDDTTDSPTAAGIVFVALQVPIVVLLGDAPAIDDPPPAIRDYLVNDGWRILWAATFSALSAFFFLWFLGSVWATLRNAEGPRARMTPIAVGAGVATITLAVTASLPAVALAWHGTAASADPGLLRAVWNLNTLAFVPIGATASIFSLAASIVIVRTPRPASVARLDRTTRDDPGRRLRLLHPRRWRQHLPRARQRRRVPRGNPFHPAVERPHGRVPG